MASRRQRRRSSQTRPRNSPRFARWPQRCSAASTLRRAPSPARRTAWTVGAGWVSSPSRAPCKTNPAAKPAGPPASKTLGAGPGCSARR
eukprot:4967919-Lingulodinium_polyedra.AAC.1